MSIDVIRGTTQKPASSGELVKLLTNEPGLSGQLFIGYPIIATASGPYPIDALLVSEDFGVVIFDLVEGPDAGDYETRQDDSFNKLQAKLRFNTQLMDRRKLRVPIETVSFGPGIITPGEPEDDYPLTNVQTIVESLKKLQQTSLDGDVYRAALSAIESISTIRQNRARRTIKQDDSLGARLKRLEDSIATLDPHQSAAVVETVEGVQRIRGLAGSGKTVVLALKATYLHAQHPEWRIAVTFNTRSLKGFFQRLIHKFSIEMTGEEPDWERLRIVNGWGAPGGPDRDGIYFEFCRTNGVDYFDFRSASELYGREDPFGEICKRAVDEASREREAYDAILVDEAQDFSPAFLQLCLSLLRNPKRLVYAYDELQNLSSESLPPPQEIFAGSKSGSLPVWVDNQDPNAPRRDIILERCYRNSRPVLVTAHALGFGIYREPSEQSETGLIQMFDNPRLWTDVGYQLAGGNLWEGDEVSLMRTADTSPLFLEDHSTIDELIQFRKFNSAEEQANWLAMAIYNNLTNDELRHDDILIINPNPRTTRSKMRLVRLSLLSKGINSHLAGVDTDADTFYQPGAASITLSGIHRVKGNEAGMVYLINAQDCNSSVLNLATIRNQLFVGITRSFSWIRVLGVGGRMDGLVAEFDKLKKADFVLGFTYPTASQREKLRIVHRDLEEQEVQRVEGRRKDLFDLVRDLESGEVRAEDLDPRVLARLKELLG